MGTSPAHPHVQLATDYCLRVTDGSIPACRLVRLACQRHLDDLERAKSADWPYRFDPEQAERVCRFMELFSHVKGEWARSGEPMRLEPWQCFKTCAIFGWLRKDSGLRRFRRGYLEEPRKQGKSFWAGLVGNYMFAADGEPGAEVYSGANTEAQAHYVFGQAWSAARRNPEFLDYYGVEISGTIKNPRALYRASDRSVFKAVIGKPGDGASPHCAIVDEYHEADSPDLVEAMQTGMGARAQPLLLMITTAGSNTGSPCYQQHQEAAQVLEGVVTDDQLFTCMWGIDDEDDWRTEEALVKANPNIGVSVSVEYLRDQQQQAIQSARKQASVLIKHFCRWISARHPWINPEHWHPCALPKVDPRDYLDRSHYLALDLSSKSDLSAAQSVFARLDEPHFVTCGRYYIPEDGIDASTNAHAYRGWIADGHLIATPGSRIDQERIFADLMKLHELCPITLACLDPWGSQWIGPRLMDEGIEVLEIPQTTQYVSNPMKEVEAMLPEKRLRHDGNPVLTWGILNVVAKEDARDNLFPRKERPENKIDPARALLMAMYPALLSMAGEGGPSVYEERGIIAL